ncbi:MAG: aminotransferase class V-fold PLP-dependent enzyme, partial [Bacteroidota bacterium]
EQLQTYGAPGTVATMGGRYFGFVTGSIVPAGLAAKHMASYWDQVSAMHVISPTAAKLESVVEAWLRDIFGLSANTVAGFVSGTSMAGFCGMAAARYRLLKKRGWDINEQGLAGAPDIRIVAGREAHSTVLKTIALLGFGKQNIEWVEVDEQGRMRADALPDLDESCLVVVQAGNVNSGSFDPIEEICRKANQAGAWVHVDGAFGLWAHAAKELKHLTAGIELAQSFAVDGHKTLNTPYDSGIVLCTDEEALVSALHMQGGYIVISDEHRDGMFYTPEMSRRARIVELWAIMKYLGREGIDELVTGMYLRARQFAERLWAIDGFTVMNEVVFNQVVLRCETEALTNRVLARVQALRECWVGGSQWRGQRVIRISVCSWRTTSADVERSVASFEKALQEVLQLTE